MSAADRDFQLVGQSDAVMEALLQRTASPVLTQGARLEAREMVGRFVALSMTLQVAMMDYQPGMSEDQLRTWAAQLHKDVTA